MRKLSATVAGDSTAAERTVTPKAANQSQSRAVEILLTGDIILNLEDTDFWPLFEPTAELTRRAHVTIGQVENMYTERGHASSADPGASYRARDPRRLENLRRAGFDVATLAGNHIFDAGTQGIEDTIDILRDLGIPHAGGGRTLAEARAPAFVQAGELTIAVLSYNAVGPKETWATPTKAGAAYVWVLSHYEVDIASPGMRLPRVWTFCDPETLERMQDDIRAAKERCDLLAVAIHKGVVHAAGELAMYERPIAHAAIDAGADIVVGHHAHLLRGVELYRGRPIFHGLSNFVTVVNSAVSNDSPEWTTRRKALNPDGFAPDPDYPTYPFHPDARYSAIGRCLIDGDGEIHASLVPLFVAPSGAPTPIRPTPEIVRYFDGLQETGRLPRCLRLDGSELLLVAEEATGAKASA